MRWVPLLLVVFVLVGAACAPADTATTTSQAGSTIPTSATPTTQPPPTTTTNPPVTTSIPDTTTTTVSDIDVFVEGGQVIGPDRFDVTVGDDVSIWLLSDVADEVHVHGYDLFFVAKPGVPVEIAFTADVPGIFEVEMESSHLLLFDLQVSP